MTRKLLWEAGTATVLLLVAAISGAEAWHVCDLNRHLSAELGEYEQQNNATIRQLIRAGADIRTHSPEGVSCLMAAAAQGDLELVRKLVARGAPVNERLRQGKDTPLHFAAGLGAADVARFLLEHGAEVDARNSAGQTPLFVCAGADTADDQPDCAWELLRHGADPASRSNDGETPAECAATTAHPRIARLLRSWVDTHGRRWDGGK